MASSPRRDPPPTEPTDRGGCVLITGGAGFIGSTLVQQWLASEPQRVVNLDKLTYAGLRQSLAELDGDRRHQLVQGDVADAALVRELLNEHRPEAILHLAAESHVDRSISEPPEFARTNVLGTCTLLDEATRYWSQLAGSEREHLRFLYMSTDEVFGSADPQQAFTNESPLEPNSPYAASKAAGENFVRAFAHTYGLPTLTINPTNNFGPRQIPEKLIPKMILAAARRQPLPVYGDGLHERDWLHVDDCCCAIRTVLRRGEIGRRYLAGADQPRANRAVVEAICHLVDERLNDAGGRRALIAHVADRPGHDRRYAVDSSRLRALGWAPQVDFLTALRETVNWYLANTEWTDAAQRAVQRRDELAGGERPAGFGL